MSILIIFSVGLLVGLLMTWGLQKHQGYQLIRQARLEAGDLLSDTKAASEEMLEGLKETAQDDLEEKLARLEEEHADRWIEVNAAKEELKAQRSEVDSKLNEVRNEYQEQLNVVKKQENRIQSLEDKLKSKQSKMSELKQQMVAEIEKHHDLNATEERTRLAEDLEKQYVRATNLRIKADMEWLQAEAEAEAHRILTVVLARFSREYCAERGLAAVTINSEKLASKFYGEDNPLITEIQDLCGIDLIVDEENKSFAVAGFDPVRRELARRILIRIAKDGRLPKNMKDVYNRCRKALFDQIQKDGNRIAKELKLKNLNTEIRKMMGCLRYRYSFSQNQYFHCSEVGWLCGLLAAELGLDMLEARRSGLLHDIGKSMDHSIDGGHAVIGADFIEKHGESEVIVHNVRAHHFDVQPSTDIAFLVIGGDALSGGRPGARRSTIDSYNQKILELETIGNSYDGVTTTYIVNGGREVRVIADGQKIDDVAAVEMSKKIASEIEETCNYPGQIKVVVVRERIASVLTQGA